MYTSVASLNLCWVKHQLGLERHLYIRNPISSGAWVNRVNPRGAGGRDRAERVVVLASTTYIHQTPRLKVEQTLIRYVPESNSTQTERLYTHLLEKS